MQPPAISWRTHLGARGSHLQRLSRLPPVMADFSTVLCTQLWDNQASAQPLGDCTSGFLPVLTAMGAYAIKSSVFFLFLRTLQCNAKASDGCHLSHVVQEEVEAGEGQCVTACGVSADVSAALGTSPLATPGL